MHRRWRPELEPEAGPRSSFDSFFFFFASFWGAALDVATQTVKIGLMGRISDCTRCTVASSFR